mgnify:CR=1 FL=1
MLHVRHRVPLGHFRRIFPVPSSFSISAPRPASDTDRAIVGPIDHWVKVLEHLAAYLGFGTFVLAGPSDAQTLRIFILVVI